MSSNPPHVTVDCRGMQCPAPIISTAKAARELRANGGLLQVMADDDAFPLDIKSWCRTSKAQLLELDEVGDAFCAIIKIPGAKPALPVGARSSGAAKASPVAPSPEPMTAAAATELDCLGMRCPQPILTMAKAAKAAEPGSEFIVTADDPAFPVDVKSWCRSSKAELLSMDDDGGTYRAHLRLRGGAPQKAPVEEPKAAAPPTPPAPQPAAPAPAEGADTTPAVSIDLRPFADHERLSSLAAALRAAPSFHVARITLADASFTKELLEWCTEESHTLRSLNGAGPVVAEIDINRETLGSSAALQRTEPTTALVPVGEPSSALMAAPREDNRCSLLVLHNDHEALLAALLVANGAAASGMDVTIFFTFWGLNLLRGDRPNPNEKKEKVTWIQRMFKWMMPKGTRHQKLGQMNFGGAGRGMLNSIMRSQNLMELPELVEAAQGQGVRFIACTMSMSVMGITKRDLHPYEHLEYGGVAAFIESAQGAGVHLVF